MLTRMVLFLMTLSFTFTSFLSAAEGITIPVTTGVLATRTAYQFMGDPNKFRYMTILDQDKKDLHLTNPSTGRLSTKQLAEFNNLPACGKNQKGKVDCNIPARYFFIPAELVNT